MATVFDIVNRLRNEVLRDAAEPHLFSDDELTRAFSEGYRLFARHTHCFVQEMPLTTTVGVARYALDPTICYVQTVMLGDCYLTPYTRKAKPYILPGKPTAYTLDSGQSSIRLYPTPDAVYTLTLECAVVPSNVVSSSIVQLPDEWVPVVMDYVAARMLNNNDPDGSRQVEATLFERRWKEGLLLAKQQRFIARIGEDLVVRPAVIT